MDENKALFERFFADAQTKGFSLSLFAFKTKSHSQIFIGFHLHTGFFIPSCRNSLHFPFSFVSSSLFSGRGTIEEKITWKKRREKLALLQQTEKYVQVHTQEETHCTQRNCYCVTLSLWAVGAGFLWELPRSDREGKTRTRSCDRTGKEVLVWELEIG